MIAPAPLYDFKAVQGLCGGLAERTLRAVIADLGYGRAKGRGKLLFAAACSFPPGEDRPEALENQGVRPSPHPTANRHLPAERCENLRTLCGEDAGKMLPRRSWEARA